MMNVTKRTKYSITKFWRKMDMLFLSSQRGVLRICPQTESIVRISYAEAREPPDKTGFEIQPLHFSDWSWRESGGIISVCLPKLIVEVTAETGSIAYFDENHRLLLRERKYESRVLGQFDSYKTVVNKNIETEFVETPDGTRRCIKKADAVFDKKLYHTRLFLEFQADEKLYGLGQAEDGVLNLRGTTKYLHQANMKIAIPFMQSSKGYGLLFATGSPSVFNDTQSGSYFYTEADEQMDFYFIRGETMDEVVKGYRTLTGKAAMLPRWAYGFIQSQERYETENEILSVADQYCRRGLGLDCLVLDWCSWPGDLWGQKSFDPQRFPDPKAMIKKLHEKNIHFMISIWPFMDEKSENYREFFEQNLLLPADNHYDAFQPEARALYWNQAEKGLFSKGVDAWWCDASEPFSPEWGKPMKPEPFQIYCDYEHTASRYLPQELTNAYGAVHARTLYEGQRNSDCEKRVVNLTRSTYTGGQKYGIILWSGDISASWDTLRKQIAEGLNFCASGFPYWTLDIGGFFVKKGVQWFWNGEYEEGLDDLGYRELFVRWFQYAAFLPVFRSHGTDVRREMWKFGDEGDMFYEALKSANQLRYRFIPYIYSWAWKVWKDDSTMMRMLAFDFAEDEEALETKDEYMFGGSILVCPVTEPMYYGVHSVRLQKERKGRTVYLPKGCDWYDFYTDQKYSGGQTIFAEAEIDRIPLFIKSGSILPMTQPLQNTAEVSGTPIAYHIYPGEDASFALFEDSGDSYRYEQGEYTVKKLVWNDKKRILSDLRDPASKIPYLLHGNC